MFRSALVVIALVAVVAAERSFINKCSISDPELEQCFARNGNLALEVLSHGVGDLDIPSLEGYDIGDVFYKLGEDLSFLLEDAKSYPKGLTIKNAQLKFGPNKELQGLELFFYLSEVSWQLKYQAIGIVDSHKVSERGTAQINFGEFSGNYTVEFTPKEVEGVSYLKARNHRGKLEFEKFEFVPNVLKAKGEHLRPEQFNVLETAVVDKFLEVSLDLVTFAFNQILQEIPEKEIFLD